jgi:uncharacterized protein
VTPGRRVGAVAKAAAVLASAAVAFLFASAALAVAWDPPKDGLRPVPPLTSQVTDLTGTLTASERQALEAKSRDWEARTSNQLVVLMVPTTSPEPIEEYSLRVAEAWKIGQKGKDNGAIFLIAKDDKRMRIEVGYGFEGVLTDVTSRRIIGETVAPYFKQGQFAAGINAGVDRIIAVVGAGEPLPPKDSAKRSAPRHSFDYGTLFIVLLVAVPIVGTILRSLFGNVGGSAIGAGVAGAAAWFIAGSLLIAGVAAVIAFVVIIFSMFGGGRGGGWIPGGMSGGGGFGGGGGGGFSGGGGSFGGGGASGGWD